jgi:hypothetical protein
MQCLLDALAIAVLIATWLPNRVYANAYKSARGWFAAA